MEPDDLNFTLEEIKIAEPPKKRKRRKKREKPKEITGWEAFLRWLDGR
jgi:hypothetical protein